MFSDPQLNHVDTINADECARILYKYALTTCERFSEPSKERISAMEHEWQKELETRVARFRSKLETQKIQLDFDDLRTKHLIEVSENIRVYTTEHGHPLEEVADVIGIPLSLAQKLHSLLDDVEAVPTTTADRQQFLKAYGVHNMRQLSAEYEGV